MANISSQEGNLLYKNTYSTMCWQGSLWAPPFPEETGLSLNQCGGEVVEKEKANIYSANSCFLLNASRFSPATKLGPCRNGV